MKERQKSGYIQTGPAVRRDKNTIEKHKEALKYEYHLQKMYSFVAESIDFIHNQPKSND